MKNGIYSVDFHSGIGDFGKGVVIVKDNILAGSDLSFAYNGIIDGSRISLDVYQTSKRTTSIFNTNGNYHIDLDIKDMGNWYFIQGEYDREGRKIAFTADARFICELR